jgi:hypothetical protein
MPGMTSRAGHLLLGAVAIAAASCASAPKPTAAAVRIAKNAPAVIEGRVGDTAGHSVAGIAVRAIPRGADIPWAAPSVTDCDGKFRLSVPAPAAYGFLLSWKGTAVITPDSDDPALVAVAVEPGDRVTGIALVFDGAAWSLACAAAPAGTPACP